MQSSKPVSTSRCLVRETLDLLVSSASMICSSVHPSPASEMSALSRIRARVTNSAERRPLRRNSSRKDRSSRPNFTMYFFSATNHLHASKQQGCLIHEYDSTSRKRDTSGSHRTPILHHYLRITWVFDASHLCGRADRSLESP